MDIQDNNPDGRNIKLNQFTLSSLFLHRALFFRFLQLCTKHAKQNLTFCRAKIHITISLEVQFRCHATCSIDIYNI